MKTPLKMNRRTKGRAFQSGRKLRVKRSSASEAYRTRLAVDPRRARRVLRKSGYRVNPAGVRIVHNRLLGGWYIVRGPHQTPLGGRFDSREQALEHLRAQKAMRDAPRRNPARSREIITITGKRSGRVLGYATPETSRAELGRNALMLANAHSEPVKIERINVNMHRRKLLIPPGEKIPAPVRAYLANPSGGYAGRGKRPYIQVTGRKVIFSPDAVRDFRRVFPASGLRDRAYWFEFDAHGDLMDTDVPEHDDGPGAAALADDAKAYLFEGAHQSWMENPVPRQANVAAAARRFTRFTGHRADKVRMIPYPKNPGAGLSVGPVLMIGYSATRDGRIQNYLHKFSPHARPQLISSHDGRQLILSGGRYKFTERGIVDARKRT